MNPKRTKTYPLLIGVLVLLFLAFTGWSVYRAVRSSPEVLDPDYYSRGLRYNQTLMEKKAAASLGWHLSSHLEGSQLTVELSDAQGKPVTRARGRLRPADSTRFPPLVLEETRPGHYHTRLPGTLTGHIRVRLELERDGARLIRDLLLAVGHE